MRTTSEIVELLRRYKEQYAEKYGIETLGLFGSVARGEQNEKSDIDIFIRLRRPDFLIRMEIKEELEHIFNSKIDLVPLFESMRALLRKNIEHDAIYI
ncbi:MAG: nucleotidyltransferase family protein [Parabacteroides sp.]|nr:nucleotidyltransferase family protein [Parabacteroides sp.]